MSNVNDEHVKLSVNDEAKAEGSQKGEVVNTAQETVNLILSLPKPNSMSAKHVFDEKKHEEWMLYHLKVQEKNEEAFMRDFYGEEP